MDIACEVVPQVAVFRPEERHWPEIMAVLRTANFHHIGGPEMPSFPLEACFAASVNGVVRGVGGYCLLSATEAKTTLLAVDPAFAGLGLGMKLQTTRLAYLRDIGVRSVTTNTDDPRVARWLERKYGFVRTGETVPKVADFGDDRVDEWVSLRVDFA